MQNDSEITRRRFLQKAAVGMGAALLICSGSAALALTPPKNEMIETTFEGKTTLNEKILVAYASKCGSTAQIAEAIGKVLSDQNLIVDVMPVNSVKSLAGYRAVVVGSAIRYGAMLPSTAAFIKDNAETLKQIPVAYFTAGSTLFDDTPENRKIVAAYTDAQKALVPPISAADFAGQFDPKKVSFAERILAKSIKTPEGDFRNWQAIRMWGVSLIPQFTNG